MITLDEFAALADRVVALSKGKPAPEGATSKDGKRVKRAGEWVSKGTGGADAAPKGAVLGPGPGAGKAPTPGTMHADPGAYLPETGHAENAAQSFGLHRELLNMAKMETDPRKAEKLRRAGAAHAVLGQAYGAAHAAKVAGDTEHADALGQHADKVANHVWFDDHGEHTTAALNRIRARHGRSARAGSNLSPEEDARAQIERAVGPAPKPKRSPSSSATATQPIIHAAPVRRKGKSADA
jgi:hypothetical protein